MDTPLSHDTDDTVATAQPHASKRIASGKVKKVYQSKVKKKQADPDLALLEQAFLSHDSASSDAFKTLQATPKIAERVLSDTSLATRVRKFGRERPDRLPAYWAAVATALGVEPYTPEAGARDPADEDEWNVGVWFAEIASMVPSQTTGGRAGMDRLDCVLRTLPNVAESQIATLRATPAARGASDTCLGLDSKLAEKGLTPLSFLRAARAVGHLLRYAVKNGTLSADDSVWVGDDGRFTNDGPLDPDAAIRAVAESVELPEVVARLLVQWLVAASEVSPFLFLRRRSAPTPRGLRLEPLGADGAKQRVDATDYAWTYHRRANAYDGMADDDVFESSVSSIT